MDIIFQRNILNAFGRRELFRISTHHLVNYITKCLKIKMTSFVVVQSHCLKPRLSNSVRVLCGIKPRYVNSSPPSATIMCPWIGWALVQILAIAYSAPNYYLHQRWVIVSWTLRKKLQWNFNQTTTIFILENWSENIVCEMVAILSIGIWVWITEESQVSLHQ